MTATKPKELIYFNFLPTKLDNGIHYMFYAVDDFSTFAFNLGVTQEFTFESLLFYIDKLMQDENFKSKTPLPFTLMCSCGQEVEQEINTIIKPHLGKVIFDTDTVIKKTQNFVNELSRFIK